MGGSGPFDQALAVVDHLGDPGLPCRVLAGGPAAIVDLATLARWRNA